MQVKVWNDNVFDFTQRFKGSEVTVPAKGHIEMEFEEAVEFTGAYSPMAPEDEPQPERFFKRIRYDQPTSHEVKAEGYRCVATGKTFQNKDEYITHLQKQLSENKERLVVDEEAEREIAARQKKRG